MKRYQTRVLVEQSEDRVEYYAQYKWHFLWCIPVWETFNPAFAAKNIADAWYKVIKESGDVNDTSQHSAERMCELYHQLCDEQEEKRRKEKLHRKTRKITSYKHP